MEGDIRKYTIILTVAILLSIFSYAFADAFTTQPDYPDFCQQNEPYVERPYLQEPQNCTDTPEPTQEQIDSCPGTLRLDRMSCEYECNCHEISEANNQRNDRIHFYIGILLGIIAIALGMLLNPKKKLNTWVGSGFILGGIITIFIATTGYWSELDKIIRPIIIAVELALVLWIAYKKFQ